MRKAIALLALALLMPCGAAMAVTVSINSPGVSAQIGSQDNRGYYWDGYDWREPHWWHSHQGQHLGERNNHGQYWNGNRWDSRAPDQHRPAPAHRADGAHPRTQHAKAQPQQNHDSKGKQGDQGDKDKQGEQHAKQGGGDNHPIIKQQ